MTTLSEELEQAASAEQARDHTAAARILRVAASAIDRLTRERDEAIKAWNMIEALRAAEGNSVTVFCDNPDFNGQSNCAVEVCGDWTNWEGRRFTGDTVLDALIAARAALEALTKEQK